MTLALPSGCTPSTIRMCLSAPPQRPTQAPKNGHWISGSAAEGDTTLASSGIGTVHQPVGISRAARDNLIHCGQNNEPLRKPPHCRSPDAAKAIDFMLHHRREQAEGASLFFAAHESGDASSTVAVYGQGATALTHPAGVPVWVKPE